MNRVLLLPIIFFIYQVQANPIWKWDDSFSPDEQNGLINWVVHAERGLTSLFGLLPYNYQVHFHRMDKGHGPCPWAHTEKHSIRAVHFYVNTSYSWETFIQDWTAPHELSHLLFPYLGENSMWFAEGIASYLQYQVMYANDTMTWEQVISKLQERFSRAGMYDHFDDVSIVELSNVVKNTNDYKKFEKNTSYYVRTYWGGTSYFLNVDKKLFEEKNLRLNDIISKYMECCNHEKNSNAQNMMETFDLLSETKIFTDVYKETVMKLGFPDSRNALQWLKKNPPNTQLN